MTSKVKACDRYIGSASNKTRAAWHVIDAYRAPGRSTDPDLNADAFNGYFTNIQHALIDSLPKTNTTALEMCNVIFSSDHKLSIVSVSQVEVRDILTGLKGSFSKDAYGISINFIKKNISLFVPSLTKLINSAFFSGEFPDLLKNARVVPVFKGGDAGEFCNYRPISVLPTFSKVFEKALYNRIISYVENNNFIYPQQFGFRSGLSTTDAVVTYVIDCRGILHFINVGLIASL